MKLCSRLVADVVEVVEHESVVCHTNWRKSKVRPVLVNPMIVCIVVVDRSLSLIATCPCICPIELAVMSVTRISRRHLVVDHCLLLIRIEVIRLRGVL